MMKIAFDATALYGPLGGIENALFQTFCALQKLDDDNGYLVFVPRDAPDLPQKTGWKWVRLPFDGNTKLRRIAWQQFELPSLLKRENCDLLHAWNYVAPLVCPIPVVLTVQDLIALDQPHFATRFNRLHYRAVLPRSLKNAARVVVSTPKVGAAVLKRAPRAQIRVVPLGVDEIFFAPPSSGRLAAIAAKYALPPRFLLYVGNFEPKKNLPALLRALKLWPGAPPLVVAGGIKAWPRSEKMLHGVQKLGFIPRGDLPSLYALCAAFCFPSLGEGFGLPVVEALACGAPVLASTRVPLPELESVAALCEPRFPLSIARHLGKLVSDAPRDMEKVAARRAYAARFSWDAAARGTLAIYREFL